MGYPTKRINVVLMLSLAHNGHTTCDYTKHKVDCILNYVITKPRIYRNLLIFTYTGTKSLRRSHLLLKTSYMPILLQRLLNWHVEYLISIVLCLVQIMPNVELT